MWKSFFYYSKSERRAFIALLFFSIVLLGVIGLMPDHLPVDEADFVEVDSTEIQAFLKGVQETEKERKLSLMSARHRKAEPVLMNFDPNTVDSASLVKMGLPSFIAHNLMKYRQKGGRFRTPADFSRLYGLKETQYKRLEPYICIAKAGTHIHADKPVERKDSVFIAKIKKEEKYPEGTVIDLAVADTCQLKKIPGIGSAIARAIVNYRKRLGGYYRVEQLKEVQFVTPEMLKWFVVKTDTICRLPINHAGLDKLRSHPYLNFYQAKVIVEYRRKKGKIKSLSQLSLYEEFTEKDLNRLAIYFSFD